MENGETISQWWKLYFLKFGIFVKRLLNKDYQKRLTTAQALSHPWLTSHCDDVKIPFDMIIHKLVKSLYTLIFFTQISYGSILDRTQQNTMCFKVNLVKEVKKDRDGIRKDIKKCKRRSHNYRSTAVYR
ncbi:CDPK-related kinase 6 isoform X3 [Vigna angularis]|uniref:CDPK-related kinase 6 isoform X3 n=1 Tax=Phaseolus angularis TaxID=3914 RepID=UPI0022B4ECEB|nr:CDPK-related kinase 6 isoform X3 [Vigna angularis]